MFRRSPRTIALWTAAVAVAAGTAMLVASDLSTLHRDAHTLGPVRVAVVARHDLALGRTITDDDVTTRRVHAGQLPPSVESSTETVLDRVVGSPVLRGGFVTARNLAPRGRRGVDAAIPTGMRAVRVVAVESIRPRAGAIVDVIASSNGNRSTVTGSTAGSIDTGAEVVAHGVVVISTDVARTSQGGTGVGATLLVTATQARELAAASARSVITLALAPPEDALG